MFFIKGIVVAERRSVQPWVDTMSLPTPEDPGRSPVWENYVVAQTVQATLGLLPENALAVGVSVVGTAVQLRFQLGELSEDDLADIDEIVSELEVLVGDDVHVDKAFEVRREPVISPRDNVRCIFLARR